MKLRDLLAGVPLTGGNADLNMEINSISYDSRTLEPGALFVTLSGSKTDGHRYVAQALEKGAAAILCREPPRTGSWLSTPDPRAALARVSAAWFGYPGEEMTLIGVTGTNGKTTTTYLIKAMLEGALKTRVGLIGTNRNLIGALELPAHRTTPEPYELQALLRRMADAGCTHVVMEVSSHALVLHRVRQSERAVLNLDDEAGRWYRERIACPSLTYSENKDTADLTAKNIRLFPGHVEFEAVARGQITRVHLPIPGGFTIYNALAALACGLCLDIPLDKAAAPLRAVRGVKGRVEVVPVPTAYTVIIDYAHTPDALENILTTARDFTAGRLICVFGCGGDRDRGKRPLMGAVAAELADLVVVTSDNPRTEGPEDIIEDILPGMEGMDTQCHVEPDRPEAICWALSQARPGDVVVLAGKGHETYQEINGVQYHLDEREVVAGYFRGQREGAGKKQGQGTENGGKVPAYVVK